MSSWMTYLGSDLVSALAGLDVDDLPHGVAVLVSSVAPEARTLVMRSPGLRSRTSTRSRDQAARSNHPPSSPLIGQHAPALRSDWLRQPTGHWLRPQQPR